MNFSSINSVYLFYNRIKNDNSFRNSSYSKFTMITESGNWQKVVNEIGKNAISIKTY